MENPDEILFDLPKGDVERMQDERYTQRLLMAKKMLQMGETPEETSRITELNLRDIQAIHLSENSENAHPETENHGEVVEFDAPVKSHAETERKAEIVSSDSELIYVELEPVEKEQLAVNTEKQEDLGQNNSEPIENDEEQAEPNLNDLNLLETSEEPNEEISETAEKKNQETPEAQNTASEEDTDETTTAATTETLEEAVETEEAVDNAVAETETAESLDGDAPKDFVAWLDWVAQKKKIESNPELTAETAAEQQPLEPEIFEKKAEAEGESAEKIENHEASDRAEDAKSDRDSEDADWQIIQNQYIESASSDYLAMENAENREEGESAQGEFTPEIENYIATEIDKMARNPQKPKLKMALNEDYITENMAYIYLMQGHTARAKAVYEKLIQRFPEKSVYFATQLEKIK